MRSQGVVVEGETSDYVSVESLGPWPRLILLLYKWHVGGPDSNRQTIRRRHITHRSRLYLILLSLSYFTCNVGYGCPKTRKLRQWKGMLRGLWLVILLCIFGFIKINWTNACSKICFITKIARLVEKLRLELKLFWPLNSPNTSSMIVACDCGHYQNRRV